MSAFSISSTSPENSEDGVYATGSVSPMHTRKKQSFPVNISWAVLIHSCAAVVVKTHTFASDDGLVGPCSSINLPEARCSHTSCDLLLDAEDLVAGRSGHS